MNYYIYRENHSDDIDIVTRSKYFWIKKIYINIYLDIKTCQISNEFYLRFDKNKNSYVFYNER